MSYSGNTVACPGCLGDGWLPGYNGVWPTVWPRPVCPICSGYGRISDCRFACQFIGMQCTDSERAKDLMCCLDITEEQLNVNDRATAIAEGRRVFGDHFEEQDTKKEAPR